MMNKVLVTGATGFVGRHLCELLSRHGHAVVAAARSLPPDHKDPGYEVRAVADIGGDVDWEPLLDGVGSVVHLAARVHVMKEQARDPLTAFRRINVDGTKRLLQSAGMRRVRRFVFVSSIKVHGDATFAAPFTANDELAAADPYAQSKREAERALEEIGGEIGLETVIIRPPLVYGPGVGGNFFRLMQMVDKGIPMPFAGIDNRRSLVYVENLCDLIRECLVNPSAPGNRLLVSDNADVSTPQLIRLIGASMNKKPRLFPMPAVLLGLAAKLAGRSAEVSRLIGSLQVDVAETMRMLDWRPPVSMNDGIRSTVTWYEEQKARASH